MSDTDSSSPLRQPFFRLYLTALSISYFGNGLHFVAVSWLVMELTGSTTQLGIILGLAILPSLFVSLPAGVLADRWNRKWLAVGADFGRGLVVAMVPLLAFMPAAFRHIGWVYAMEIGLAILTPFYNVATASLVRECVPNEQLLAANRYKEIAVQLSGLLGAGCAGFLVAGLSSYGALAFDALTFLGSATCLTFVRYHLHAAKSEAPVRRSVFQNAKEGWQYVRERPTLLATMVLALIPYVTVKALNVLLADFVKADLGGDARVFGFVDAGFAVGAVIGGIAVAAFAKRMGTGKTIKSCFAVLALAIAGFSVSHGLIAPIGLYALIGFFVLSLKALLGTTVQSASNVAMIGRVQGLQILLQSGVTPLILFCSGRLADFAGARPVLLAFAGLAAVGFICLAIRPSGISFLEPSDLGAKAA